MTTNNHPANGPVSLDRLHQIREILSKAAAQSDGGNLGYAMADAVKVIDGAIAAFDADPQRSPVLAYADSYRDMAKRGVESIPVWSVITDLERNIAPLYATPPSPVVPEGLRMALSNAGIAAPESDEMLAATHEKYIQTLVTWVRDRKPFQPAPVVPDECKEAPAYVKALTKDGAFIYGFNAFRAAMLKAGNSPALSPIDHGYRPDCECSGCIATARICEELASNPPVTPDGWIPVSERMPENKPGSYEYIVFESLNNRAHHDYWNVPDGSCDDFSPFWNHYGKYVTHWMPLPAAPQQEVKHG